MTLTFDVDHGCKVALHTRKAAYGERRLVSILAAAAAAAVPIQPGRGLLQHLLKGWRLHLLLWLLLLSGLLWLLWLLVLLMV